MHASWIFSIIIFFALLTGPACAELNPLSIEGEWYIIDHKKHRPSILLKIKHAVQKDTYEGFFLKIFDSDTGRSIKWCQGCAKAYEKARVKGMPCIKDLVYVGSRYENGKILDPRSGSWYPIICKLKDKDTRLAVHAYTLFSWVGKTEVFVRK
jgi:Uncharacterized protein conserved in bacteria (DUF2147)